MRGNWFYEVDEIGYNYRLTDFQCALGISQLKKLKKRLYKKGKLLNFMIKILRMLNI